MGLSEHATCLTEAGMHGGVIAFDNDLDHEKVALALRIPLSSFEVEGMGYEEGCGERGRWRGRRKREKEGDGEGGGEREGGREGERGRERGGGREKREGAREREGDKKGGWEEKRERFLIERRKGKEVVQSHCILQ